MAPLPEHMDPEKLFVADAPPKPEKPVEAEGDDDEVIEAPEKPQPEEKPKAGAKPDAKDEEDDEEVLTLDDLQKMLDEDYERRRKAEREAEEDEDLDPKDREIKSLRKQLEEKEAHAQRLAEDDKYRAAKHEVDSCVGKYKMSQKQIDNTIAWFENNPDLEGHPAWGFERVALRVNPELRTPASPAPGREKSRDGDVQPEPAKVISRGASGGAPPPKPKSTPQRGVYSDVTRHVMSSGAASRFFKPE